MCLAQSADDGNRQAARALGASGVDAYQAGNYAVASDKLDKAYRVLKAPTLGLWSARAFVKVNRLIEASERYLEVQRLTITTGEVAVQRQAQADAATEHAQLANQIPNIVVQVRGASENDVTIQLDGAEMSSALIGENRPVNPGRHSVVVTSLGRTVSAEVEIAAGETKPVTLDFNTGKQATGEAPGSPPRSAVAAAPVDTSPEPTAPTGSPAADSGAPGASSPRRTLGFVALGVGGVGLALGGITGALALGKKGEIEDSDDCRADRCLPSEQDLVDSYLSFRTISTVGFIAGGALAATGLVLVLTAPQRGASTALAIGPGSLSVTRSF